MDKKHTQKEDSLVDVFKKAFFTGVGAIFMTEEAIRNTLSEMSLPQEVIKVVMKNAQRGKEEVMGIFQSEIQRMIEKVDFPAEVSKFLETHEMQINVKFSPKNK